MKTNQELVYLATQIRRDIVRMVHGISSGHPGGSLGCADLLTVLFFDTMKYNASSFSLTGKDEDVFYLSNGHISPLYYSVLSRAGFFSIEELSTFRKINSRLQGHPTNHDNLPGIRIASGSLGQVLSVGCGTAIAKRVQNDKRHVFVLTGDGELQEGQVWEAAMFAAHHNLGNLIAFVDYNNQQIDGTTSDVMSLGNLENKFTSFDWQVLKMDGHNIDEIKTTIENAKLLGKEFQKPTVIITKTTMGKGVDFMEDNHQWHGIAPNDEQLQSALNQLHLDSAVALIDY